ncbi:MAG TPA: winged helix-turn-helix transcriptional regulator [Candidatus Deferrimicrobium sp.]|nr:winged helix-turn-helix transcriptional regulator [Candidatus Deferrimicrobium sp.]
MKITFIKEITSQELIHDFEKTYGSLERLEEFLKRNPDNMKALVDFEDWKYHLENPDVIKETKSIITHEFSLDKLELILLDFIKTNKPKSIRELAKLSHKNIKNIHAKIKKLEKAGLIALIDGPKNSKIPILNYQKIEIEV